MSSLSTLSASLLGDTLEKDVQDADWTTVSASLAALRLRTQEELSELTTALELVESPSTQPTVGEHDDVLTLHNEIKSLQPQLTVAEQHFTHLESIVRPGLSKLQQLQTRAKYLEAAVQVEQQSQKARKQAVEATPEALEAFRTFAVFAAAVPEEFTVIQREAARRVEELAVDLRRFAVEKLQFALEQINWPEPLTTQQELTEKETELQEVSKAFAYLLALQLSQQSQSALATIELWAMDCVLEPLLLRFRYHFERAESATNRLAKPEWFLSYVQEQTAAHTRFLAHVLTPELHRHREEVHCWDAQILLLRGIVKAACRKLTQDLPFLLTHPPLLCHTLDEVLLFEQSIDDEVGYNSWANADRRGYPRCIDVFTSSNDVLFAWTRADVEYAHRLLTSTFEVNSSRDDGFEWEVSRGKRDSVWQLDGAVYGRSEGFDPDYTQELVPPAALQFVALLDFLSQRFTLMEMEEHRYLYVMQVHLPLLHRFGQLCDARGRELIGTLTSKPKGIKTQNSWGELFVVVNALQHVANALTAWEQSSVFLELAKKVTRSETTRAQVLRMHMAYSKQVLARASAAVLATEEATAVRQALAGPGAMIGPTAAFSAAYSVGSKTMKSLFRRVETDEQDVQQPPSLDGGSPAAAAKSTVNALTNKQELDDSETLLFSHTIFERQVSELKALATTLLDGCKNALMRAAERDVESYRLSSFWMDTNVDGVHNNQLPIEVSSELASCYSVVNNVLECARKTLLSECRSGLWKPLAVALDGAIFAAFSSPPAQESSFLSHAAERQFIVDIKSLVAIFTAGSSKPLPRSYFQLTREVCHLLEMPALKLREVCKALDDKLVISTVGNESDLERLTTILEACGIFSLTPAQVVQICTTRLHLDKRGTSTV